MTDKYKNHLKRSMTQEQFKREFEQAPKPIKCSVKDSKGNNCEGIPKRKIVLEDKDEAWFCESCYRNHKNGAYKGI